MFFSANFLITVCMCMLYVTWLSNFLWCCTMTWLFIATTDCAWFVKHWYRITKGYYVLIAMMIYPFFRIWGILPGCLMHSTYTWSAKGADWWEQGANSPGSKVWTCFYDAVWTPVSYSKSQIHWGECVMYALKQLEINKLMLRYCQDHIDIRWVWVSHTRKRQLTSRPQASI